MCVCVCVCVCVCTNIKIAPTLGLRNLLSTRPGLIHSYHRPYHVFHHQRANAVDVAFGKQNHKGMGNTNHIITKSVLIPPLERIQEHIQDIPMNCTEQSSVTDNENDLS